MSFQRVLLGLGMCAVMTGCGGDKPKALLSFELRAIDSFDSELWTGRRDAKDPVVARVEGAAITRSMLEAQLDRAGPEAKPRQVLNRMIEFELLARAAFRAGLYRQDVVGEAEKKALARAWVDDKTEYSISPADIPDKYMRLAYKAAHSRYDHFERFFVADVQILCCTQDNPESCYMDMFDNVQDRVEHLRNCFEYHAPEAKRMHAQLEAAVSQDDYKARYEMAAMEIPSPALAEQFHTAARYQLYDFQYDVDSTWEEQFDSDRQITYRVYYKEVMDGSRDAWLQNGMKTPALTPVIKSPLGYHILYIYKVLPEQHWGLDRPEVQAEIREHIYDKWRQVYFSELLEKQCAEYGCQIEAQRLVPLQEVEERR